MTPDGSTANSNGNQLESLALSLIQQKGYKRYTAKDFLSAYGGSDIKIFASQVTIGDTIYQGKKRRCDIALYNPAWKNKYYQGILIIECKWQQSSGSVDEKFPYLVLNINHLPYDTVVLMDGGGFSLGSELWLRSQTGTRLKAVYNMKELMTEANKGLFD